MAEVLLERRTMLEPTRGGGTIEIKQCQESQYTFCAEQRLVIWVDSDFGLIFGVLDSGLDLSICNGGSVISIEGI